MPVIDAHVHTLPYFILIAPYEAAGRVDLPWVLDAHGELRQRGHRRGAPPR